MDIGYRDASIRAPYGRRVIERRTEATCGAISAYGANRTEAKAALLVAVERQCEHAYQRRYLTGIGHDGEPVTFALYYAGCWSYDIVRAGRVACSTGMGVDSFHDALASMTHHFEQYTESPAAIAVEN